MAQPVTQTVILTTYEPSPPPPIWPVILTAVLVLLAAAAVAWWRGRAAGPTRPRRRTRILVAAGAGGGAALVQAMAAATNGVDFSPSDPAPQLVLFVHFLVYWISAAVLIGMTDLLFDALRPSRSLAWLILGAPSFAAFIIAFLRITGWMDPLAFPPTRDQATVEVAAVVAGLIWWSWLPAFWDPVAEVFE